jgi:lipid A 3-O-deacylase
VFTLRHQRAFAWHGFLAFEGRWVVRDLTLDGNTFRDGPSVERRPFVGDAAFGLAMRSGRWRLALSHRSREFDGQRSRPSFGSLTIARSF